MVGKPRTQCDASDLVLQEHVVYRANSALALVTFSLFGAMFFMSQYFQSVQGYTALETGLRILPMALVMVVASGMSARVSQRLGIKISVGLGILLAAGGMLFLSQVSDITTPYSTIFVGLAILAVGMGMSMPPATDSIMGSVPVSKAGIGSAMNDTTRQLGGALGVAVLGTIMNDAYLNRIAELKEVPIMQFVPDEAMGAIESSIQGAHMAASRVPAEEVGQIIRDAANEAFVLGMTDAMLIGAVIMAVASLITFIILPAQIRPPIEEEELPQTITAEVAIPAPAGD